MGSQRLNRRGFAVIRQRAPAKINFFLEITGRRPNGYHTLSTIFQTISLADTLTFRAAPVLRLTCSDPALPVDENNLVLRAARRLQSLIKEDRGASIHLEKKIPMGAGLGGGSSDAAATLLGLQALWKKRLPERVLMRCAAELGADVPFFLKKGLCAATGIGERLRALPALPTLWMVVVYPGFGIATREAYSRVRLPWSQPRSARALLAALIRRPRPETLAPFLFNRFEEVIFPLRPELQTLKEALNAGGAAGLLMSGSGSAVFALARSKTHAIALHRAIGARYRQSWRVYTTDS